MNVVSFQHVAKRVGVYIGRRQPSEGGFRLSEYEVKVLSAVTDLPAGEGPLYAGLTADAETVRAELRVSPQDASAGERYWPVSFLKKYYGLRLAQHFKGLGMPVQTSFVSDTDVWVKCKSPYDGCDGYRVFSLRVQFNAPAYVPELVVIAGDVHSVFRKPVTDPVFSEVTEGFGRVLFENDILGHTDLPEKARRHMEKVFPCVSFGLLRELGLRRPAPDRGNRYLKIRSGLEDFKVRFLTDGGIAAFMNIDQQWKTVQPARLGSVKNELQFGNGKHTDPHYGMKSYGPRTLITDHVVFFFIFHLDDLVLSLTINDYLNGIETTFKGGLADYLKMKYNIEKGLSIVFTDRNNPLPEVKAALEAKNIVSTATKRYVALYLSPHSKTTTEKSHRAVYYQLKEELLLRGIVSQTIDAGKVWGSARKTVLVNGQQRALLETKFHYSLPNILVAVFAKLGGTPWCLEAQESDELVIGVSAYKSRELDRKYLGSAFSFSNEGKFQGFDCFRNSQLSELAGSIALAVDNYCARNRQLQRLVIHFYKKLSRREIKPIEAALSQPGLSVPVVVVSVNKACSDDLVGLDLSREHLMPLSGTYVALNSRQYLLYNNQLVTGDEVVNEREGYPMPLKITIEQYLPGEKEFTDVPLDDAELLLGQVCRFSQLYWKSVSRQWMPVTLRYPEMLAQLFPHFKYKDLTREGSESLWFL